MKLIPRLEKIIETAKYTIKAAAITATALIAQEIKGQEIPNGTKTPIQTN